ncbi:Clavaminate synthase-like protein [Xylariaceae sp. FL0255]|nr:Clavaminate synthase-like protein [Xylariaceae sp. FL0255]
MKGQDGLLPYYENLILHVDGAVSSIYSDYTGALSIPKHPLASCDEALIDLLMRQTTIAQSLNNRTRSISRDGASNTDAHTLQEYDLALKRVEDVASVAYSKFYAFLFKDLPACWRQLYTDARILEFCLLLLRSSAVHDGREEESRGRITDELVKALDLALILAGGAGEIRGRRWIDEAFELLALAFPDGNGDEPPQRHVDERHPSKRPRLEDQSPLHSATFSSQEAFTPPVQHPIPRVDVPTIDEFQTYLDRPRDAALGPEPVVYSGVLADWPAMSTRPWNRPAYLLSRTLNGRRLVPVEIGRSYVDDGWGQKIVPFRKFLCEFVDPSLSLPCEEGSSDEEIKTDNDEASYNKVLTGQNNNDSRVPTAATISSTKTSTSASNPASKSAGTGTDSGRTVEEPPIAYLAQHQLFTQLPGLRNDIRIPDLCYTTPPPIFVPDVPELDEPILNAWFGPAGTISPLHHDPYHNILAQVVGRKYVRLYAPHYSNRLAARGRENGVEMGNTSLFDVGVLEGWDPENKDSDDEEDEQATRGEKETIRTSASTFRDIPFVDCILEPGDALYIPVGWWHYVRGLRVSFSVSFWWN